MYLARCKKEVTTMEYDQIFIDNVVRLHGLLEVIIFDRDPRFTGKFWRALFDLLGIRSSVQYCVSSIRQMGSQSG